MPIETVPGTSLKYYLVTFDASGNERDESDGKISHKLLVGLKQISSPDKAQSRFISEEYVPIVIQPLHKTERHRCPKRL